MHVRAPDAVGRGGGGLEGVRLIDVAEHTRLVAPWRVVGRQVRDGEGEVRHLGREAGFVLFDGGQGVFEQTGLL